MSQPFALIIEDHANTATVFATALDTAGYDTEIISDGQAARARLAEVVPAVVVLDLHLPNVSGEELFRQIRDDGRLQNTRIILATADPQLAKLLEPQADLVLIKPISFDQLSLLAARFRPADSE